ncbi:tRNA (5-methylaminomethyl-2-thiouridine)(34)-methyltransferase MnmD [Deinococcus radiophilus]|uniref:MnmC-like methyltransferase domain-containing protein n=1 Tax=Deinococcus radiophilus TaxID=32062 RepID=A0A431W5E3_9DEIO|nr:tRNA (5-methylaminomethyl-2-thiouridine)(34)-methyltransferase MnmD [Deinococcus radiophilus]RTR30725.1 hypothetical protein EJ104_00245 [Deinococcus radiophilus]UFA51278.1 tRNA (5-methylaminomethyl-2-thiouridine)(34)-methyltransferase MnmD [Deinococcus radiophilus]
MVRDSAHPATATITAQQLSEADLRSTADGSLTVHSVRFGQTYGSVHGAQAQARHVFVQGSGTDQGDEARVLEIGFGVGQNFRATLEARQDKALDYLAYEFDPVSAEVLRRLDPPEYPAWTALLNAWPPTPGTPLAVQVDQVRLRVQQQDALVADFPAGWATAVYLDGFSPDANPELWSETFLARVAFALAPGGVLTTYSAAGRVRRALQAAGLEVERCPGPPGKREFLRAVLP